MRLRNIIIVGTGMIGPGVAAVTALAGLRTTLVGRRSERTEAAIQRSRQFSQQLVDHGLASPPAGERALTLLTGTQNLKAAASGADFVIEAIVEDLEAKRKLFCTLEEYMHEETLITSTTSGLSITAIAQSMQYPERATTSHCWFPAHLMPLVEVVMGERTSEETAQAVVKFWRNCGKEPVLVRKDMRGQLANRVFQAVLREAIYIVQAGLASAEDIDTAIKTSFGLRFPVWGPLEHLDAVGLDLALAVQEYVLPGLDNRPEPPDLLRQKVGRGDLGVRTGKGFYDWNQRDADSAAARRDQFIIEVLKSWKQEKGSQTHEAHQSQ
jgi:3-hydroxybutyryl-CoA dehydrogenase